MSMFLSRISLNPLYGPALRLASDPNALHRRLLATLNPQAHTGGRHLLFRVDATEQGPIVLLQTPAEPDWSLLELAPRALRFPPESKPFAPILEVGERLAFRLLSRPSKRLSGRGGGTPGGIARTGKRTDCRTDEERSAWLRRKGADAGFAVETVGLTIASFPAIKPSEGNSHSFSGVRFDGVMIVREPGKLLDAVERGIGQQKAFGFGLLSLAPLRE